MTASADAPRIGTAGTADPAHEPSCNLCGAPVPAHQRPHWVKDGYAILKCGSCGLLFRGDLPSGQELGAIYAESYFLRDEGADADGYADYLSDETEHRLNARRRLARLDSRTAPGRVLDVGAAAGFFVDEARMAGWDASGIDVSPEMSAWGREKLGLGIATGLFQATDYEKESFDAVTMWDYIEHSIDPAGDFEKASRVLRPGGVLMLSTGNADSLVARLSGRRWHLLTPRHHNFFFTVRTLRRYLSQHGFEVEEIGHPSARYSFRYIVYKLGTMAPRSRLVRGTGEWMGRSRLGERSLGFNLFDIVTVTARRR